MSMTKTIHNPSHLLNWMIQVVERGKKSGKKNAQNNVIKSNLIQWTLNLRRLLHEIQEINDQEIETLKL